MRNLAYVVLMLAGVGSLSASAQKANLNGTWNLNVAKSFMGGDHPFSDYRLTKKIEQTGQKISITDTSVHNSVVNIPLPDSTTTMSLTADGQEHGMQQPGGFPGVPPAQMKVTATWQGCTLELRQITSGLADYAKHRLFVSDNGSQLTDLVEQHSTFGDSEQRLIFDRVP
jgi:hypothetical protein